MTTQSDGLTHPGLTIRADMMSETEAIDLAEPGPLQVLTDFSVSVLPKNSTERFDDAPSRYILFVIDNTPALLALNHFDDLKDALKAWFGILRPRDDYIKVLANDDLFMDWTPVGDAKQSFARFLDCPPPDELRLQTLGNTLERAFEIVRSVDRANISIVLITSGANARVAEAPLLTDEQVKALCKEKFSEAPELFGFYAVALGQMQDAAVLQRIANAHDGLFIPATTGPACVSAIREICSDVHSVVGEIVDFTLHQNDLNGCETVRVLHDDVSRRRLRTHRRFDCLFMMHLNDALTDAEAGLYPLVNANLSYRWYGLQGTSSFVLKFAPPVVQTRDTRVATMREYVVAEMARVVVNTAVANVAHDIVFNCANPRRYLDEARAALFASPLRNQSSVRRHISRLNAARAAFLKGNELALYNPEFRTPSEPVKNALELFVDAVSSPFPITDVFDRVYLQFQADSKSKKKRLREHIDALTTALADVTVNLTGNATNDADSTDGAVRVAKRARVGDV